QRLLARGRVPNDHVSASRPARRVLAAADDVFAVGAPGDAHDRVRVLLEGQEFLARVRVPDPDRVVKTAAGDALAVGAEGHAVDAAPASLDGEDLLARFR